MLFSSFGSIEMVGTYCKDIGRCRPPGLETEVDIGSIDQSSAKNSDDKGAYGEDIPILGRQVIERLKRVFHKTVFVRCALAFEEIMRLVIQDTLCVRVYVRVLSSQECPEWCQWFVV